MLSVKTSVGAAQTLKFWYSARLVIYSIVLALNSTWMYPPPSAVTRIGESGRVVRATQTPPKGTTPISACEGSTQ